MNRIIPLLLGSLIAAAIPCQAQSMNIAVPVRFGDCRETFSYRGELEACESVSIHAPDLQETNLMTIRSVLDDGTRVKAGDVVLEVEDATFRASLEAARQECDLANAEYDRIRFDLANEALDLDLNIRRQELELEKARVMVVEDSVAISRIEMQKAKLNVELAELELQQAKRARAEFDKKREAALKVQELAMAAAKRKMELQERNIEKSVVRAPKDGIVFKPFVRLNNDMGRVEPNKVVRPGDKLLELPNMDRFQGVVYIPSPDFSFIQVGGLATLTLTIRPDLPLSARVANKDIYPVSRNERLGRSDPEGYLKEYKAVLELAERNDECRPGLTFQATVESLVATNCLFISRAAVVNAELLARRETPALEENDDGETVAADFTEENGISAGNTVGAADETPRKKKKKKKHPVGEGTGSDAPFAKPREGMVWVRGSLGPEKLPITVGRSGVSFVEVLSGLASGTEVFLDFPAESDVPTP